VTQRTRNARLYFIGAVCVIATLVLWSRLVQVQVLRHNEYSAIAQKQREDPREIPSTRGGIFDRHGRPLALNAQMYSVSVTPGEIKDRRYVERVLAKLLPVSAADVRTKIRSGRGFTYIKRQIPLEQETRKRLKTITGVAVHSEIGRVYPYGGVASKVVGFVGLGNSGLGGVEASFNKELSGIPGEAIFIRNGAYRSERYQKIVRKAPVNGKHIYLTIDAVIQEVIECELTEAIEDHKASSGSIIVMDVETGEILGLAEYPYVSNREKGLRADSLWTIRSISHVYEPGSTFKVVTAAALLETKNVSPVDSFYAENGTAHLQFATIRDTHPHGTLSFQEGFSLSSNIVMAKASRLLTSEEFYKYVRLFGFGAKTGIRLDGESTGRVPAIEDWSLRTKCTMAFGQEVAVTPLQMLNAMAAIANGGKMMMPRIIRGIGDSESGEVTRFNPVTVRNVVSRRTAQTLQSFCRSVVEDGTGVSAAPGFIEVSGKTGTAQKAGPNGYIANKYVASFIGYAPHDDPQIAVLVILDEPRWASRYGGASAAPVFAKVCRAIANATPIFSEAVAAETIAPVDIARGEHVTPNFLRMERGLALERARSLKSNVLCRGESGRVVAQDPSPGVPMGRDDVIRLYVSDAAVPDERIKMPDLRGLSMRSAKLAVAKTGLIARFVGVGMVRKQNPKPGAIVSRGFVKLYCGTSASQRSGGTK